MSGIPLDKAELLALFLECIVYGIFLTFFIFLTVITLGLKKGVRANNQRFILPVAALMVVLATGHLTIDFVRILEAFVTGDDDKPAHPIKYYQTINHPLHVAKTSLYVLQTILGDSVLVWRCYIVSGLKLYVLIPAVLLVLANFGVGIVCVWSLVARPGKDIFQTASTFITAWFVLTMILNLGCTCFIVAKIWLTSRSAPKNTGISLFPVIAAIVESGFLYSSSMTALLIAFLSGSNGQYAALDLVTPIVGLVFCLIVLQIHFHLRMSGDSRHRSTNWSIPGQWRQHPAHADSPNSEINLKPYSSPNGVAVRITEHVETRRDQQFKARYSDDDDV